MTIAAALRLLQGYRIERRFWAKPISASFFNDIVPGWNDSDFRGNFCVSHATFAYLVNEVQTTPNKHELLRSSIPVYHHIAISLWRLVTHVEYRTISHLWCWHIKCLRDCASSVEGYC